MNKLVPFSIALVLIIFMTEVKAQQWHAGDTLNTADSDSIRINQFRDNMIDWTGQDLVDASFPNSIPIFGTKSRIAFGGYVKLDYIQDFDGGYDRFQYEIQSVPVPGDGRPEQSGYMNLHTLESRFNVDFRGISEKGRPYRVFLELDFFNTDRGPFNLIPRLRHFYGVLGRLLIGRTWGTQSDLYAVPNTIDFAAGDAITGTRRAQVRFEDEIGKKGFKYAVALEMLEYPGIDGPDTLGQPSQLLPLLAGRITKSTSHGGRLMLSASVFQLRWDGQDIIPNSTAIGWGVSFSGREYFGKNHYFFWMTSYGQGWGSQIVSTIGTQASAILSPEGELETMPAWNLGTGLAINLTQTLVTNFNINWYAIDPSVYRAPDKMKNGESAHLNLIWSPLKKVNTGVEYMILRRTNTDNSSGVGQRLQFMIKYVI